ncbi:MAG TPA: type II toxin-antitoxin system RelE/ParE family toxin [Spirochaetota bacterium]|nr:type II toxin-antitoxin system RelE/ParE family toxin [Spirochaetota bacterium]
MNIRVLTSVLEDLLVGRFFYDKQAAGLGDYFFDSLFSDIDSLALNAGIHPDHYGCYRMLSKRFPYAIYYKIDDDNTVVVWRVLDIRGDPEKIKKEILSEK